MRAVVLGQRRAYPGVHALARAIVEHLVGGQLERRQADVLEDAGVGGGRRAVERLAGQEEELRALELTSLTAFRLGRTQTP